jgi:hypothetical protein
VRSFPPRAAGAPPSGGDEYQLPAARATAWQPGLTYNGGFPHAEWPERPVLSHASGDQTARIQAEINAAKTANPDGVIVRLAAGTWNLNGGDVVLPSRVVLRGAGPSGGLQTTILTCTNGATDNSYFPGARTYQPMVTIGGTASQGTSTNLTSNAVKGAFSVNVASVAGLSVGQFVLIDQLSGAGWQTDPQGMGQVWANPDFSVVWQRHDPSLPTDDPYPDAWSWFCRFDRPQTEIKQISAINGNTVTFNSPFHLGYTTALTAQLTPYSGMAVYSGVEDLACSRGDNGNIRIEGGAYCWVRNVDASKWLNENVAFNNTFRCEITGSYLHDACWPVPGGGGYILSFGFGSSEFLVENSISIWTCKNMVARCAGAGGVIAYNYCDVAFDMGAESWMEVHLNASHMVGPHHVLFEGNYAPNADSDKTHGNSTSMTFLRNHLSGRRIPFSSYTSGVQNDATMSYGPARAAGMAAFSRGFNWVGNVMGLPGQMSGWTYEDTTNGIMTSGVRAIYSFGWDDWYSSYPTILPDVGLLATTLRDGNYDYLTDSVRWHGVGGSGVQLTPPAASVIPASLYAPSKPAFFGANTWPWVDPQGATKTFTLPAKARYESGSYF